MCSRRMRSSACILDLGGAHDFVPKVPRQIVGSAQIHLAFHLKAWRAPLPLQPYRADLARSRARNPPANPHRCLGGRCPWIVSQTGPVCESGGTCRNFLYCAFVKIQNRMHAVPLGWRIGIVPWRLGISTPPTTALAPRAPQRLQLSRMRGRLFFQAPRLSKLAPIACIGTAMGVAAVFRST